MSFTYGSYLGYQAGRSTYSGYGQLAARRTIPESLSERLRLPNAKIQFLLTVTIGKNILGVNIADMGISLAPPTLMVADCDSDVIAVRANNGEQFIPNASTLSLPPPLGQPYPAYWTYNDATSSILPSKLILNPIFPRVFPTDTYQAIIEKRFSRLPTDLRGKAWQPRIIGVPNLSLRIEPKFSGIGQIGGGKITLNNADGYFDSISTEDYQWDAGTVTLEMGIDTPTSALAESDYQQVGSWRIESVERTETEFVLNVREYKTKLENQIPYEVFSRDKYPAAPNDLVGEPIPYAWGKHYSVEPALIDGSARRFKVAVHPIRGFEGVRVLRNDTWTEVAFQTVDLRKAEFTLSASDWEVGDSVAVDFQGRTNPDGSLMENPADVMADLLDYVGETNIDADSFAASRRFYQIGTDKYGEEVTLLAPCIRLSDRTAALDVASQINSIAGSFLFVDLQGAWRFGCFSPVRGVDLDPMAGGLIRTFTERDIIGGLKKSTDSSEVFSSITINYAKRTKEEWTESLSVERPDNQLLHNTPKLFPRTEEVALAKASDARYWGQRTLTTEAEPLVKYSFVVPWSGFFLMPGDKAHLTYTRFKLDAILEVLEIAYDLINCQVKITAGNQRGWRDTFGFWTAEERIAPAAPTPLPVAPIMWLKVDSIDAKDFDAVATWPDSSGFNRHATQSTLAKMPTYRTNQLNGFPVVRFGRNSSTVFHMLQLPTTALAAALRTGAEIFTVLKVNADPGVSNGNAIYNLGSVITRYPTTIGTIQEGFATNSVKTIADPTPSLAAWRIWNVSSQANDYHARLDGTEIFTTATNTFIGSTMQSLGSGSLAADMDITEVILFDRVLSTTERAAVIQYLSDRYAIGLVAPAYGSPEAWLYTWTDAEVAFKNQNLGFWTVQSAYGSAQIASPLDIRSTNPSRWY